MKDEPVEIARLRSLFGDARPDYGLDLRTVRRLVGGGDAPETAIEALVAELAAEGAVVVCAGLDEMRDGTRLIPNRLAPGDSVRMAHAVLGKPDEMRGEADGGATWAYRLTREKLPHENWLAAVAGTGGDRHPPERSPTSGPPRRLRVRESLWRELRFGPNQTLERDEVVARQG